MRVICLPTLFLFIATCANAAPGESIVLDPNTGNYIVTYLTYDKRTFLRATFEPATKIEPKIKSRMKLATGWLVSYRYRVSNGKASRKPIIGVLIDPISSIASSNELTSTVLAKLDFELQPNTLAEDYGVATYPVSTPTDWNVRTITNENNGLRVSWSSFVNSLPAGQSLSGFGFLSNDLPGVVTSEVQGDAEVFWTEDEGPQGEVGDQLETLVHNNYVPYNIAAPLISVPTPFDPAIVLDNLRSHVATWPSKQLADATLAAQLDAELLVTANAYRTNQPEVARDHIEILLDMIRREHKDIDHDDEDEHDNQRGEKAHNRKATTQPIRLDRLAARVLDFDLKYVLKRMKKDDEQHESKKH